MRVINKRSQPYCYVIGEQFVWSVDNDHCLRYLRGELVTEFAIDCSQHFQRFSLQAQGFISHHFIYVSVTPLAQKHRYVSLSSLSEGRAQVP